MNKTERIKSLVAQLNEARKAYYAEDREIMSNLEYDKLYEELEALEQETGMVLAYQHQANRHRITAGAAAQSQMKPRLRWLQLRLGTGRHKE